MKEKLPLIKLFNTSKQDYYMFDANKNCIIKVSKNIYDILEQLLKRDFYAGVQDINDNDFINFYKDTTRGGFFSNNRVEFIEHPMTDYLEEIYSENIESISLQVTQNCNLHCDYCPYSGNYYNNRRHSNKKMTLDIAKKGVDFLLEHSSGCNPVNIAFYGGEPLLEYKLIQECINYAKEVLFGKDIIFSLTTNGTLINSEIMKILEENDILLTVSLDGPQFIHDRSRVFKDGSGSFSTVINNLRFMKENYPGYFKTKVNFNTVMAQRVNFSCVNDFFSSDKLFSDSYIATTFYSDTYVKENPTSAIEDEFFIEAEYEKLKVLLFKLNRTKDNSSIIFSNFFENIAQTARRLLPINGLPKKFHPSGPCIPASKKLFLNANGNFYPCERVNEDSLVAVIGTIYDGIDIEQCKKMLNIATLTEQRCKECWAFMYCKLCVAQADDGNKLSVENKLNCCMSMKESVLDTFKDICVLGKYGYDFNL